MPNQGEVEGIGTDGLPMGTRPGQLDPGVVLYLIDKGMSPAAVQDLLYHDAGLKGLSCISNDVRALEASTETRARFALDYFAYRVALHAGMLAASLNGLDPFVFTAGVGENSAAMRARIAERIAWLGAELDPAANAAGQTRILRPGSWIPIYVPYHDPARKDACSAGALISYAKRSI